MARTACSEACLAAWKFILCVKSTRCPRDGTPVFGSSCAVPPQKSVGLFSVRVGCSVAWNPKWTQLGMERTTTSSLVPFQPLQPGRNQLRHTPSGLSSNLHPINLASTTRCPAKKGKRHRLKPNLSPYSYYCDKYCAYLLLLLYAPDGIAHR